jgi:hypothetical protein
VEPNAIYSSRIDPTDLFWVAFYSIAVILLWRRRASGAPVITLALYGYGALLAASITRLYVTTIFISRALQSTPIKKPLPPPEGFSSLTYASFLMAVLLVAGNVMVLRAVLRSGTSTDVA